MRGNNKPVERKKRRRPAKVDRRDMAVKLPEITGPLVEFACLVRAITGEVTRGTAENRSGISHDTVARMWKGEKVGENMILRFAANYRTDPNPLLIAAGYKPIAHYNPDEAGAGFPANAQIPIHGGETAVVRWTDQPDVEVEITPEVKALLSSIGREQKSRRSE